MNISIMSHSEILEYADPVSLLEEKLLSAALHFRDEFKDAEGELQDLKNQHENDYNEDAAEAYDKLDEVISGIRTAISRIESGLVDEAKKMLEDYV